VPNIVTPAPLAFTAGAVRSFRVAAARLTYTAGNVMSVRDSTTSGLADVPKLDRINRLIDKASGETDAQFQRRQLIWQRTMEAIEAAFAAVNQRVDDLTAILARLTAAEALAQTANDMAVAAVAQVEVVSTAVAETFSDIDPIYGDGYGDRL